MLRHCAQPCEQLRNLNVTIPTQPEAIERNLLNTADTELIPLILIVAITFPL